MHLIYNLSLSSKIGKKCYDFDSKDIYDDENPKKGFLFVRKSFIFIINLPITIEAETMGVHANLFENVRHSLTHIGKYDSPVAS